MTKEMTIAQFRKELKAIGFNVKTRTDFVTGKIIATIIYKFGNGVTKKPTIFTEDTLNFWKPAIDIKKKYMHNIPNTLIL